MHIVIFHYYSRLFYTCYVIKFGLDLKGNCMFGFQQTTQLCQSSADGTAALCHQGHVDPNTL